MREVGPEGLEGPSGCTVAEAPTHLDFVPL